MPPHAPRDASPPAVDLGRFLEAQAPVIERALGELRAGAKRTHWMWFVFPQLEGLGRSATARRFALGSRAVSGLDERGRTSLEEITPP